MSANHRMVSTIDFAKTCHKVPALISYRVRCGKPKCHCAEGTGHGPYWFLRWRDQEGCHRRRYVRQADLEPVRAIVSTRRVERDRAREDTEIARFWLRARLDSCGISSAT